ncbi:hypothetical protein [Gymnodinialimonas sp. 57CJ19]|uniref:hypothetical protein n=1 Tax=Gymnodinialimonas sp. 57CJ19 TaxID=3138498 RepID=UPI0031343BDF
MEYQTAHCSADLEHGEPRCQFSGMEPPAWAAAGAKGRDRDLYETDLEYALTAYDGSLPVVSHDAKLLERIGIERRVLLSGQRRSWMRGKPQRVAQTLSDPLAMNVWCFRHRPSNWRGSPTEPERLTGHKCLHRAGSRTVHPAKYRTERADSPCRLRGEAKYSTTRFLTLQQLEALPL